MVIKKMYGLVTLTNQSIQINLSKNYHGYTPNSSYMRALNAATHIAEILENNGKIWVIDPITETNNTFMVIDVETANSNHSSICQIGIAVFQNNQLIDTWQSLVDPQQPFSEFNIGIHGISEKDIQNAPTLPELAEFLATQYFQKYPATSYGHFDRIAFDSALPEILNIDWLDISYMVRRTWYEFSQKGYGLANVTKHLGITMQHHHNALSDAIAAGEVLIHAFSENGLNIAEWQNGVYPKSQHLTNSQALTEPNSEGDLFSKSIVFTGELSMTRSYLEQLAMAAGLAVRPSVSSKTDYLVNGIQTAHNIKDGISSKLKKALEIKEKGGKVQIITEQDFFDLINLEKN